MSFPCLLVGLNATIIIFIGTFKKRYSLKAKTFVYAIATASY